MNPEPIAPAAPILVLSLDEEEDAYPQQQEVEDRINIDICTTKHKSGTGLRVEKATGSTVKYSHRSEKSSDAGNDRITIDFRTDIRPPHQQQRQPELGLGGGPLYDHPQYHPSKTVSTSSRISSLLLV